MVGDMRLFQEHSKNGSNYAWNGQWEKAVQEYRHALDEFPDDGAARTQLAMALYKSGQLQEALELYQQLWNAQPSNLPLLQKLAEIQEALGDRESALTSYQLLAEIYRRRRTPLEALKVWLKAVKASPNNLVLWDSLVDAAIQADVLDDVMPLYLNLARDLALEGRFEEAIQVVEKAQVIDPQNPLVLEMLSAIRRALEYSWHAAVAEEEITPEKLADLIPPVLTVESPVITSNVPERITARPRLSFTVPLDQPSPSAADASPQSPPTECPTESVTTAEREAQQAVSWSAPPATEPQDAYRQPIEDETTQSWLPEQVIDSEPEDKPELVESTEALSPDHSEADSTYYTELSEASPDGERKSFAIAQDDNVGVQDDGVGVHDDSVVAQAGDGADLDRGDVDQVDQWSSLPAKQQLEEIDELPVTSEPLVERPVLEELQESQNETVETLEGETEEVSCPGIGIAQRLIELAETRESLGEYDEAAEAYKGALELSPGLPRALLGLARIHLSRGELDLAECDVCQLLERSEGFGEELVVPAVETSLAVAKEQAVRGNLGATAETLYKLQYGGVASNSSVEITRRIVGRSIELLGRAANEHLEEIVLLPMEARAEVIDAFKRIETLLEGGKLRASADEIYELVTAYPDFLPAQLMLAGVLVAQGRPREAEEKAQRLADLYDMRGAPRQAQKVLKWMAQAEVTGGDAGDQLVELQSGEPSKGSLGEPESVQADSGAGETGDGQPFWAVMLDHAETGIASGHRDTAVELVRAALDMDDGSDPAARAALLRILQVMEPDEVQRSELAELLRKFEQPQHLAD